MAKREKLMLAKGVAIVQSRLKRLPQGDDTWEADFQAMPKLPMQSQTRYLGMVVTEKDGSLLADLTIQGRPAVDDLAALLSQAMRRPMSGNGHRPQRVLLRGHRRWKELFPVLEELGIEVSVEKKFTGIKSAYRDRLRQLREKKRAEMVKPSAQQMKVETLFPAIARYVREYGYIEIGNQESFGFVVRALGYGGLDFEDDSPETLADAMTVLEAGLARWFEEQ